MSKAPSSIRTKPVSNGVIRDQLAGAQVLATNLAREASEAAALSLRDTALSEALAQTQVARILINDRAHVLGSELTKHGESAELLEIGVRSARDVLHGREISVTDPPSRISHVDYRIGTDDVQSKFINGTNNGLAHVLDHMDKTSARSEPYRRRLQR
jgi:hypothetical protein